VGESVAGDAGFDDLPGEGEAVDDGRRYLDLPLPMCRVAWTSLRGQVSLTGGFMPGNSAE
jgi:hypothetical protein